MIEHFRCFCNECVSYFGTLQKHNIVLDAKRQLFATVHHCSQGDIGQSKVYSTLTNTTCIQMVRGYNQFCTGIAFSYLF